MSTSKPNAFDYLSTQEFTKEIDRWALKEFTGYSRRTFAKWAGVASPNFVSLVIEGKRPLRGEWLEGLCKAAKIPSDQRDHLRTLSEFESTRNPEQRKTLLEQIHRRLSEQESRSLAHDQLEALTHPLAWTVLQMLDLKAQKPGPIWFKQRLREPTTAVNVSEALALLKRLGLLKSESGKLRAAQSKLTSPDQISKSANALYHQNVLAEAARMLDLIEPGERSFGSLTATVERNKIDQLKAEINKFGQYLMATYASKTMVDGEVLRLNIQLYPLTSKSENSDA